MPDRESHVTRSVDPSANDQYRERFRSYRNDPVNSESLTSHVQEQLRLIERQIKRGSPVPSTDSRFPGGRLVHALFRRLQRRHHAALEAWTAEINQTVLEALRAIHSLWEHQYRHEFDLARRTSDGILDRFAELDSLRLRTERLEQFAKHEN